MFLVCYEYKQDSACIMNETIFYQCYQETSFKINLISIGNLDIYFLKGMDDFWNKRLVLIWLK
jgi:hypothetical protein